MVKYLLAALLSATLIQFTHQSTPAHSLNNSVHSTRLVAHKATVAEPATQETQAKAQEPEPAPEPEKQPVPVPTTHEELMQAAGIDPSDYGAVDYIVSHESSWNQDATEPTTRAHGLVQALPFSKTGCAWEDAVCTLAWGQQYAIARYGGWWNAQAYWSVHRNW